MGLCRSLCNLNDFFSGSSTVFLQKLSVGTFHLSWVTVEEGKSLSLSVMFLTPVMEFLFFSAHTSTGMAGPMQVFTSLSAQVCNSLPFSYFIQRYRFLFL